MSNSYTSQLEKFLLDFQLNYGHLPDKIFIETLPYNILIHEFNKYFPGSSYTAVQMSNFFGIPITLDSLLPHNSVHLSSQSWQNVCIFQSVSISQDYNTNNYICECGCDKIGSPMHSSWCPKSGGTCNL